MTVIDLHGKKPGSSLTEAIFRNDPAEVEALLKAGADLHGKDRYGNTPLKAALSYLSDGSVTKRTKIINLIMEAYRALPPEKLSLAEAAQTGHVEAIAYHIEKTPLSGGNAADYQNALIYAVERGHVEAVKLLLQAGANANAEDARKISMLGLATLHGHEAVVEVLLKAGAAIDALQSIYNRRSVTALMLAACQGKLAVVKALVAAGANLTLQDADGNNALSYARDWQQKRVVNYLEPVYEKSGASSALGLHDAASNGAVARVQELIAQRADLNEYNKHGVTPLMVAAKKGQTAIVAMLCEAGADVQAKGQNGSNLWEYALWMDTPAELVRCLIKHGLDPNLRDSMEMTPLMRAAGMFGSSEEVLRVLLESGADINASYTQKLTPELEKAKAMLKAAGSRMGNNMGGTFTVLEFVKKQRQTKAYNFLKDFSGAGSDAYDDAMALLKKSATLADAAFQAEAERIGEILQAKPKPWTKRKGVLHYITSLARTLSEHYGKQGEAMQLFQVLQEEVAKKGYTLVYAELEFQGKPLARLLLFPFGNALAALAASGTNGDNHGLGPREIVNWCAQTQKDYPLSVIGAGFDFMELGFTGTLKNPQALAKSIAEFCPDCDVNPADARAVAVFAQELAQQHKCFFWWD